MTDYISSTPTDINSMQIGDVLKYLDGASEMQILHLPLCV